MAAAPISAPRVAVPTLMTAAVLMPAGMRQANGSSTRHSTAPGGSPRAAPIRAAVPGWRAAPCRCCWRRSAADC